MCWEGGGEGPSAGQEQAPSSSLPPLRPHASIPQPIPSFITQHGKTYKLHLENFPASRTLKIDLVKFHVSPPDCWQAVFSCPATGAEQLIDVMTPGPHCIHDRGSTYAHETPTHPHIHTHPDTHTAHRPIPCAHRTTRTAGPSAT